MNFGDTTNTFTPTKQETSNNILSYSSCLQPTTPNSTHITTPPPDSYAAAHRRQLYARDGSHVHWDPHLTCLHLESNDKRARGCHGGATGGGGRSAKTAAFGMVPRCQVEGCHVALVNAKEYHRRHRVCDMHSKAPKVVVLGLEQRFCQQCSRFHVVSEFDDSKRSCRRRLAGHNERRRKSSHLSVTRSSRQGCALSLLSFGSSDADLSTRCSAALLELIAENRAALMTRQQEEHVYVVGHHDDDAVDEEEQEFVESNYFPQHMFFQTQ